MVLIPRQPERFHQVRFAWLAPRCRLGRDAVLASRMLGLLPTTPMPVGGWDELLSEIGSRPGLSDTERVEAKTSLLFFRASFGENWAGLAEGYPFASTLTTSAQGGPVEAVRVYRLLHALGSDAEVEQLLVDLRGKNWEHYASADMVLRIAAHFRARGLELEIPRHVNKKVADIRVTVGRRTVTIECSALREPKARQAFDDFFQKLLDWTNEDLERRGRLRLHFLGEFNPSALRRLWSTMSRLVATGECASVPITNEIRVEYHPDAVPQLVPIEQGPRIVSTDTTRLASKLIRKASQLDVAGPTALILRSFDAFLLAHDKIDAAAEVLVALPQTPMVSAVLLYEDSFLPGLPFARALVDRGVLQVVGHTAQGLHRQGLLIANPAARMPLEPDELTSLFLGPWAW